jgi:FkbM family methyltransferase
MHFYIKRDNFFMGYFYTAFKKVAYRVLDVVTMGNGVPVTINDFKLKLPTKYFRLFPADYEASSFEFFKKHAKPGATIIDIGAHIGLYSVFFYKLMKGKVYSFEPTPSTVEVLRKTIHINNADNNIIVTQAAVSEKPGVATFYSNDIDVSTSNSLVDVDLGDNTTRAGAYEVEVLSTDYFRSQNKLTVDFIKIDAEGVELEVLKGARETFLQDRPTGILGLHPFAYTDRITMLGTIWDILIDYNLHIQMDGQDITKEQFCNRKERVFDVELLPR